MTTHIIGGSVIHARLLEQVSAAASTAVEVLILGPSGVGKELYARRIHEQSPRAHAAFIPINCGALPADLFENELFGHVGGAFTGALKQTPGLIAEAEHGTLFLDEVDSLPLSSQVKLLRLIQQKEYRQLGDPRLRHVDVRIIAATNANLLNEVKSGRFRFDLFFRLRVLPIEVPPLKDRREDIPILIDHFNRHYAAEYGKASLCFSKEALQHLWAYEWPGNIRELENCVRYLLCMHGGSEIQAKDLPLLGQLDTGPTSPSSHETFQDAKRRMVAAFERQYLEASLQAHQGNIAAAARASGKHRRAFFELMRRYGLTRSRGPQHDVP
jgi:DNA-binding NtrC family response regulator